MCGASVQKGDVDHNVINYENYLEEVKRQDIEKYALADSVCLLESILNYRQRVFDKYQIDIFGSKLVYTASSLAMRIFKTKFYNKEEKPLYIPTMEANDFARNAYKGGSNVIF